MPLFLAAVVAGTAAGSLALDAQALWDEQVTLFASATYAYDDNVYRLPDVVDPLTAIGSEKRGTAFWMLAAGLDFDVSAGEQHFVGFFTVDRNEYDRFPELDHTGHDGQVAWEWALSDWLAGDIGYADWSRLASPGNLQNGVQSNDPNFLDGNRAFFTLTNSRTARWQTSIGVRRYEQSNSSPDFFLSDIEADTGEFTFAYATPASSRFGIGARVIDATLPNRQEVGGLLIDNSYRQDSAFAFVEWPVTTESSFTLNAGAVRREFDELPQRDYDTWAYLARYRWAPTDTVTVNFVGERTISTEEDVTVGIILSERVAIEAYVHQTEKIDWQLSVGYADRTYQSQPAQVLFGEPPRDEQLFDGEIRMAYHVTDVVAVDLRARYQSRTADVEIEEYDAAIFSAGLRIEF